METMEMVVNLMKMLAAAVLMMGIATVFAADVDTKPKEEAPQAGPISVYWCPPLC